MMMKKLILAVVVVLVSALLVIAANIGEKVFLYPQPVVVQDNYIGAAYTGRKTPSCNGAVSDWWEISDSHQTTVEEYCTLTVTYDISDYDSIELWYGVNWDAAYSDVADTVLIYAYDGSSVLDSLYPLNLGTEADIGDTLVAGADALGDTMIYIAMGDGVGHWLTELTVKYILIDTTAAATTFHLYGGVYAWDVRRAPVLLYPTKIETYSDAAKGRASVYRWDRWQEGLFKWQVSTAPGGGGATENYDTFKYSYDVAGFDTVLLYYGVGALAAPGDSVLIEVWTGSGVFDSLQAVLIGADSTDAADTLVQGTDTLIAILIHADNKVVQWQDELQIWFMPVDTSAARNTWWFESAAWGW